MNARSITRWSWRALKRASGIDYSEHDPDAIVRGWRRFAHALRYGWLMPRPEGEQ